MLEFLMNNWGTIIVCALIVAAMAGLVYSLIKDKKKGKTCCGGCSGCAMSGSCSSAHSKGEAHVHGRNEHKTDCGSSNK